MDHLKLSCTNCGYKFMPKDPGKIPENCPYCNKPETLEKAKTAQDLIDEVGSSEPQKPKEEKD